MAEDDEDRDPEEDGEGFVLIDGRLLGRLLFPYAWAEVERLPPANDPLPPAEPPHDGGEPPPPPSRRGA